MKIFQFVHTLNYGDAISGEAISISRLLTEHGISNQIYSVHAHEKVAEFRKDWRSVCEDIETAFADQDDVSIVLHYSIASPLNQLFRQLSDVNRVLIYHNLTPVHWFESYNARVSADLEVGRNELRELLPLADIVLGDSRFNKSELGALGRFDVEVLPLLLDEKKWSVPANSGIRAALKGHGGKNILHVGRMAPNKCIEDIIKSFYFYHHKIEPRSKLWLIGSDVDTEIYSFELRRLVNELRLKECVEFVGSVADCELRAFYENSDLYLCMSEHEGFCVPLLEAMYFGLPIIAFDSCAIAETLADGGVLVKEKKHAEIAELMSIVIGDEALRKQMQENAKTRVKQFNLASFNETLFRLLVRRLEFHSARRRGSSPHQATSGNLASNEF